jgi:hypothetical protein
MNELHSDKIRRKIPRGEQKIGQEGDLPYRMKFIQLLRGKKLADLSKSKVCLKS